jgi:uncharacterized membrane protein YkoI
MALAAAVAVGALGAGGAAMARERSERGERENAATEQRAVAALRVGLAQAIAAAEQATGGRAIDAGINDENGAVSIKVETVKGSERQEVTVNATTGQVMQVAAHQGDDADED